MSCVVEAALTVASVPLNHTLLEAATGLRFVPTIVTTVPTAALTGEKLEIVAIGTVKLLPEQPSIPSPTLTQMGPVAAPAGAGTVSCVAVAEVARACPPLKLTSLSIAVGLKFVPVIVTMVPTGPLVGVKLVMVGRGTVKLLLEQPDWPPVSTQIGPVEAPDGTDATICVPVLEVTVA